MTAIDRLKNCFLCRELNDRELQALADIASIHGVEKGETLFWEGDPATGFYILLSGSIRIYHQSEGL